MVEAGLGSALSIDGILETKQTNLRFIPLYPALTAKISLIWRKNTVLSTVAALFLEQIKVFNALNNRSLNTFKSSL